MISDWPRLFHDANLSSGTVGNRAVCLGLYGYDDVSSLTILIKINVRPSQVYCLWKGKKNRKEVM